MTENIIQTKSFQFAVEIVETYKTICSEKREFVLSKQLLRSGTSIGANICEAQYGQSTKDFIHKLQISRKEASETLYWIKLLEVTKYISTGQSKPLTSECVGLLKILTSIIKSTEQKLQG